jgi:NADPH-dependent glutamate synthase beta subunit-like oxidoreductase
LTLEDLGLKGATLFYRRRSIDMPLSSVDVEGPEQLAKAQNVRQKILDNYQRKYLFHFQPCWSPVDKIIENDRLAAVTFQKNEIIDGKVVAIPGKTKTFKAPLFISSIGSVPEKIEGIPSRGQVFDIREEDACQLVGFENVFALGNAVTGRGNIIESQKHGREIAMEIMDDKLHWQEEDYQSWLRGTESGIQQQVNAIADHIERQQFMPKKVVESILEKTNALQNKVGYDGNYSAWIAKHLPIRLENMLENQ